MESKNLLKALACVALLGGSVAMFSGCTKKESTIAGTLIGVGAGAGIGAAVGDGAGAAIGAVVGGASGGLIGHSVGDEEK